jgi:hypothetical protein
VSNALTPSTCQLKRRPRPPAGKHGHTNCKCGSRYLLHCILQQTYSFSHYNSSTTTIINQVLPASLAQNDKRQPTPSINTSSHQSTIPRPRSQPSQPAPSPPPSRCFHPRISQPAPISRLSATQLVRHCHTAPLPTHRLDAIQLCTAHHAATLPSLSRHREERMGHEAQPAVSAGVRRHSRQRGDKFCSPRGSHGWDCAVGYKEVRGWECCCAS